MTILQNKETELNRLYEDHFVTRCSIFGSYAKNSMNEGSDIDFLVRFSENLELLNYADNFFGLQRKLEELLKRRIDLVTEKSIKNPILKKSIDESKVIIYES